MFLSYLIEYDYSSSQVRSMDQSHLLTDIAILLAAALLGGMIAHRLRQPLVLGYLVVGMVVGPHALGVVEDVALVETAATIGVALLMFTLGLEVSLGQLKQVGKVGLWGGIAQVTITFALGLLAGVILFRWSGSQAALFGLIISLSSTAVCLKILRERGELNSVHGRIMIAILILQDISVVAMMIILPAMGDSERNLPLDLATALGKAVLFIGIAIASGLWIIPWIAGRVAGVRSRELFLLLVLLSCLGAAVGTHFFGLSIVFGAFLIGLVMRESRFGHQALTEIGPLRDIFATLFFVSLGMLLDPRFVRDDWTSLASVLVFIIFMKLLVIFVVVKFFGYSRRTALLAGAGLFQIGEFGFILAQAGFDMDIIDQDFYSLILASAIITMLLTPLFMNLIPWLYHRSVPAPAGRVPIKDIAPAPPYRTPKAPQRVVIAGYGRIGQTVALGLEDAGIPHIVIDIDPGRVSEARTSGSPRIYGDASNAHVLSQAGLDKASAMVITFSDPAAVMETAEAALHINPKLDIVARVGRANDAVQLKTVGVMQFVNPEYEASLEFLRRILTKSAGETLPTSTVHMSPRWTKKRPTRYQ